jgi:LysR family hydrogen peroxide-inducible transcriptional activator
LKIFLIEEKTEKLVMMLENGELDCAFLAMPINENDFNCAEIFQEPFYLALSHDHKLAKRGIIAAKNLENHELMLLEEGHCMRDQALKVCESVNAFESTNFRASSLETLRQMVKIGAGITLIPQIAIQKDDEISYVAIKHAPKRSIGLYWRKSYYRQELIAGVQKVIS